MDPGLRTYSGLPGCVDGPRPSHYDPWPHIGRSIASRMKGQLIAPGRVVCVDSAGLLWLPNVAISRTYAGLSMQAQADGMQFVEEDIQRIQQCSFAHDMSVMRKGELYVEADGEFTGVCNVHAASTGDAMKWAGVLTSRPVSSVEGEEILSLTAYDLVAPTTESRVWYASVNLP